ncbi:MAG: TIGR04255 family protein [Capsulimonadaceae bacterium]
MADYPLLTNAPITEALIDIRVRPSPDCDIDRLRSFGDDRVDEYPNTQDLHDFSVGWQVQAGQEPVVLQKSAASVGRILSSSDTLDVVNIRPNLFTYSRLKPYQSWSKFKSEARSLWCRYIDMAAPLEVTRVALRYVNRLVFPFPFADIRDYMRTIPAVASEIDGAMSSYVLRIVLSQPNGVESIVTQVVEPVVHGASEAVTVLDIDVFSQQTFDPRGEDLWLFTDVLRDRKNQVFFNSLTDKTMELFQ